MASGINNWVHDKGVVTEKDIMALERAKKLEKKREKAGYRFVKLNERIQLFVPCDKHGIPTEEGQRRIAAFKASQDIK